MVSPRMVSEVLPSPSLASVIFVGVMGRPIFLQKAVLIVHADVHPVSHIRYSVADFYGSNSLVISTGSDGVGLTLTLLLCMVVSVASLSMNLIVWRDMELSCSLSVTWSMARCPEAVLSSAK